MVAGISMADYEMNATNLDKLIRVSLDILAFSLLLLGLPVSARQMDQIHLMD
jgi:hypothetical protein